MSTILPSNNSLIDAMRKVGLLPDECVSVQILTEQLDAPLQLRYVVNVKAEQVPLIAEAYRLWGEQIKADQAEHEERLKNLRRLG